MPEPGWALAEEGTADRGFLLAGAVLAFKAALWPPVLSSLLTVDSSQHVQ